METIIQYLLVSAILVGIRMYVSSNMDISLYCQELCAYVC